jgi:hypothetical protein
VLIDVEFDMEDHISIPRKTATTIRRGLKSLDVRTGPRTKLNLCENPKKNNIVLPIGKNVFD